MYADIIQQMLRENHCYQWFNSMQPIYHCLICITSCVVYVVEYKASILKNGGRGKQGIQVHWESRPVSRLEGDPLKGIAQIGYSALFPPP